MWIGLLRGSSDETFSWVREPFPPLYSNWALGEPNNFYSRGENCGHMYIWNSEKAKQWNDELCVNPSIGPMVFMCEIEPANTQRMPLGNTVIKTATKTLKSSNLIDGEGSGEESGSGEFSSGSESGSQFDYIDWFKLMMKLKWTECKFFANRLKRKLANVYQMLLPSFWVDLYLMELYVIKFLIVQTEKDSLVDKMIEGSESRPFSLPSSLSLLATRGPCCQGTRRHSGTASLLLYNKQMTSRKSWDLALPCPLRSRARRRNVKAIIWKNNNYANLSNETSINGKIN